MLLTCCVYKIKSGLHTYITCNKVPTQKVNRTGATHIGSALGPYLANCTMMFLPSTFRPAQNKSEVQSKLSRNAQTL